MSPLPSVCAWCDRIGSHAEDCPDFAPAPAPSSPLFAELLADHPGSTFESFVDDFGRPLVAWNVGGSRYETHVDPADSSLDDVVARLVAARELTPNPGGAVVRTGRAFVVASARAELRAAAAAILDNPGAPTTAQRARLRTAVRRLLGDGVDP